MNTFFSLKNKNLGFFKKTIVSTSLITIVLLTILLRIGGLTTDSKHGVHDWHPDSGRYFAQTRNYIRGCYKPVGNNPYYTGNPYANILFLSWIWHVSNKISRLIGQESIPKDSFTLSIMIRIFYVFLSVIIVFSLFIFTYLISKSYFAAIFSSLLYAVSPLAIGLVHTIKPELPLTCFLTLSACFGFLISQKKNLTYYIWAGIFAGIATAMKYNGSIALVYIFLMHTYRCLTSETSGKSMTKKIAIVLFSPRLIISFFFWGICFYATEPILWNDLKQGLTYIHDYLRITANWGLPKSLTSSKLKLILHNIKVIPQNLLIFFEACSFYYLVLIPLIFFAQKTNLKKYLRIAYFPFIIIIILFLMKSFLDAEYLLHPQPFMLVLSALGLQTIFSTLQKRRLYGKLLSFILLTLLTLYSLYIGSREAKYFVYGNTRYYAQLWANQNLKNQCIKTFRGTISSPTPCNKKTPLRSLFCIREMNYKPQPNNIILKSIHFQKRRPLLHHLLGDKIIFFANKTTNLTSSLIIPDCPSPILHESKKHIFRFLNGIDFNPQYNTFLLHPRNEYTWTFVSTIPLKSIDCLFTNGNHINKIKIIHTHKKILFLPYERKQISIPMQKDFPWQTPHYYTIKLHTNDFLHVSFRLKAKKTSLETRLQRLAGTINPSTFTEWDKKTFRKIFKQIYHYDFQFLTPFLLHEIKKSYLVEKKLESYPLKKDINFNKCMITKNPFFLERGKYNLNILGNFVLGKNASISFYIKTLTETLAHKTIKNETSTPCSFTTLDVSLPFRVRHEKPSYFVIIPRGKTMINLKKISIQTRFEEMFKEKLIEYYINKSLVEEKETKFLIKFLHTLNPSQFNLDLGFRVGKTLFKKHLYHEAERWLKISQIRDPINKKCLLMLNIIYKRLGNDSKAEETSKLLYKLDYVSLGDWTFKTGLSLKGFQIPSKAEKGTSVPVLFYLSLPAFNGDQSIFLSFEKNGHFYFGQDFSLLDAKPFGSLYKLRRLFTIPKTIPSGLYNVFFTFRMPKIDFKYPLRINSRFMDKNKVLLTHIRIIQK